MEKQYLYLADVAGQLPEIPKNSVLSTECAERG